MTTSIFCPHCGATMNHHADKVVYTDQGEQITEFHQCPNCGAAASRLAATTPWGTTERPPSARL